MLILIYHVQNFVTDVCVSVFCNDGGPNCVHCIRGKRDFHSCCPKRFSWSGSRCNMGSKFLHEKVI